MDITQIVEKHLEYQERLREAYNTPRSTDGLLRKKRIQCFPWQYRGEADEPLSLLLKPYSYGQKDKVVQDRYNTLGINIILDKEGLIKMLSNPPKLTKEEKKRITDEEKRVQKVLSYGEHPIIANSPLLSFFSGYDEEGNKLSMGVS